MNAQSEKQYAAHTAADYMDDAKKEIDARFGDGYAAKHPELVCEFMRTAAYEFRTAVLAESARLRREAAE